MKASLYQLFFINYHVVTQIIKSQLIISHIGDVTGISRPSFIIFHTVEHNAHGQSQEFMNPSHPLGITVRQVVVDRYNIYALSFQCIQIGGQGGNQSVSFAGTHLSNTALMQDNTTDQLYPIMFHIQNTLGSLPDSGKGLGKNIIQRLPLGQTLFKLLRLFPQLFIAHLLHLRSKSLNLVNRTCNSLKLPFTVGTKQLLC